MTYSALPAEDYTQHPVGFARLLIGCFLVVGDNVGKIVETEAYTGPPEDYSSHAYTRQNTAGEIMQSAGLLYVYSIHAGLAANITCAQSQPGAVLIRAIEPMENLHEMIRRRSRKRTKVSRTWDLEDYMSLKTLTNGPSKLAEALGIRKSWNGTKIGKHILLCQRKETPEIATTQRIGISASQELPWRFCDAKSQFLSRKLP